MKKIMFTFILGFVCFNLFSNNSGLIKDTKNLILKTFYYTECNPIHVAETVKITDKFEEILKKRNVKNLTDDYNSEIRTIFKWIYDNGYCTYEDSPDLSRMKMRRALCYASIALVSSDYKADTFIKYAKLSIIEYLDEPDYDLLESQFLGLILIEIMLKLEQDMLQKTDIDKLDNFLRVNKTMISEVNYSDAKSLIEKYRENVDELG